MEVINMFRTNVSRGITFVFMLTVLIVVLVAMAYGWVGSGQFTWKQVALGYLLIVSAFSAGIWWVSKGEGWDG